MVNKQKQFLEEAHEIISDLIELRIRELLEAAIDYDFMIDYDEMLAKLAQLDYALHDNFNAYNPALPNENSLDIACNTAETKIKAEIAGSQMMHKNPQNTIFSTHIL